MDERMKKLVPKEIEILPSAIKINDTYHSIITADGYPRNVEDGWLQTFMSKNDAYDISMHIEPSSINETLAFLHNQIIRQTSDLIASTAKGTPNPSLEIKLADTKKLHDALYKGEEKMFRVSLYINAKSKDKDNLELLLEKCKSSMNSLLIIPRQVKYNILDGFISALPIGVDAMREQREFTTSALAASFPFLSTSSPDKTGLLFAHEEESKVPIFIDFDSMSNKHFFIIGTTGSGKSYSAKNLIMQALFFSKPRIYILDPNAEYRDLCKCLGGENIKISRDSDSSINIFDLAGEDLGDKLLGLLSAFDIIVGGLSESQKGVLNEILPAAYESKGIIRDEKETWNRAPPTFSDVYRALSDFYGKVRKRGSQSSQDMSRSTEVLMNRVGMYTKAGFFGFLDKPTKIDLTKRFVNFDLSDVPAAVKPLMMFTVLDLISREIKKDKEPKIFLIDEGWALLKSKEAENYLLEFIKTSRKYGASIGFVTQELEDLLGSDSGRSILNLTATKILMRQNTTNAHLIAKTMGLNQYERDLLVRCPKGHGLLITERGHYKFFTDVSPKMHDLITTDPNEIRDPERRKSVEEMLKRKEAMQMAVTVQKPEDLFDELDMRNGFFVWNELNEKQRKLLIELKGYSPVVTTVLGGKKTAKFLVKPNGREGGVHFVLKRLLERELIKRGKQVETYASQLPDLVVRDGEKRICFEVETGTNRDEDLKEKFDNIKANFDDYCILVSNCKFEWKYKKYGRVFTRGNILKHLNELFS